MHPPGEIGGSVLGSGLSCVFQEVTAVLFACFRRQPCADRAEDETIILRQTETCCEDAHMQASHAAQRCKFKSATSAQARSKQRPSTFCQATTDPQRGPIHVIHTCLYAYMYVCVCTYIYICTYISSCVYILRTHMYVYIYIYPHISKVYIQIFDRKRAPFSRQA